MTSRPPSCRTKCILEGSAHVLTFYFRGSKEGRKKGNGEGSAVNSERMGPRIVQCARRSITRQLIKLRLPVHTGILVLTSRMNFRVHELVVRIPQTLKIRQTTWRHGAIPINDVDNTSIKSSMGCGEVMHKAVIDVCARGRRNRSSLTVSGS